MRAGAVYPTVSEPAMALATTAAIAEPVISLLVWIESLSKPGLQLPPALLQRWYWRAAQTRHVIERHHSGLVCCTNLPAERYCVISAVHSSALSH